MEITLGAVVAKLDAFSDRQAEMNATLRDLAGAVNRLSVIEERQTNDRSSIGRAFGALDRVDMEIKSVASRVEKLEQHQPMQGFTNGLVIKIVWLVLAAVVGAGMSGLLTKMPLPPIQVQGLSR